MSTMTKESETLKTMLDAYRDALKSGKPFSDADFTCLRDSFAANREDLHRHICSVTPLKLVVDNTPA